jgi:adenosine deaminase
MRRPSCFPACVAVVVFAASFAHAQTAASNSDKPGRGDAEARAARAYQAAMGNGPLALYAFLEDFPKGADLHVHLSGAVYAESFIRAAGEDGLCVDTVALKFAKPPCDGKLGEGKLVAAIDVPKNQDLYDRLVDSFSMRSYVPTTSFSGHDQFFSTFEKFGGLNKKHVGEWVDEVASRAAAQNEQYLELMETPTFNHAAKIAYELGWNPDLAAFRQALLDHGLKDEVEEDRGHVREAEARRKELEHCGTAQATAACKVEVRYIYQILRGYPPQQVFAQTLLGFETIAASMEGEQKDHDGGFVGINFVMPEDGYLSMKDYELQMKIVEYLHSVYPKVHISLHAGELAQGMVPPEGLRFHIREAVELGHAERIGHGVDVLWETDGEGLLKELAQKHVMVEINLSSNEGILGVKGAEHPFPRYLAAHVPVALSTDDEGVSRIEITHEYTRAAKDYRLTYRDLKMLARTGMEHNFLPGASLWASPDLFGKANAACGGQVVGGDRPTAGCRSFLEGSEKATAQWELERRFRVFEGKF